MMTIPFVWCSSIVAVMIMARPQSTKASMGVSFVRRTLRALLLSFGVFDVHDVVTNRDGSVL